MVKNQKRNNMKKKSLIALVSTTFALTAIAVTGSMVLSDSNLLRIARANPTSVGSYTFTAADFKESSGNINKGAATWHYNAASVSDGVVTISGAFYTTTKSGSEKSSDQRRGNGYTTITFQNLDKSSAVGLVLYAQHLDSGIVGFDVNSTITLTSLQSIQRRGLEFAMGGGSFSFTSMTVNYECSDVVPTVEIQNTEVQIGVEETANLTAKKYDVFAGDVVSYEWVSDDTDVATVVGNELSATVTGKAAGSATVTVTMTVNGKDYTDTLEVTVTAAAATVEEMAVLDTSGVQGAGIFCRFDPSSASVTAAQLDTYTASVTLEFSDPNTNNAINHYVLQEKGDASYTAYVVCDSAVGLNSAFTITVDFKDNTNNVIYRSVFHFDQGALVPDVILTATGFSVNEGEDLEVTASKPSFIEGEPTFVFQSMNAEVFTVTAVDNVATVRGVAEGSADLKVTMTVGGKDYVVSKSISVTAAGVQHLIPWYTEGEGNQSNHWLGAGIWTWVNYGTLGYTWAEFSQIKAQISVSYASNPSTTVTVDTISDDLGAKTSARVYILAGAAYNSGVLTMSLPNKAGVLHTGTITFVDGVATAYNA